MDNVERAEWILRNGAPDIIWIYEVANEIVYMRPSTDSNVPPWISMERKVYKKLFNKGE